MKTILLTLAGVLAHTLSSLAGHPAQIKGAVTIEKSIITDHEIIMKVNGGLSVMVPREFSIDGPHKLEYKDVEVKDLLITHKRDELRYNDFQWAEIAKAAKAHEGHVVILYIVEATVAYKALTMQSFSTKPSYSSAFQYPDKKAMVMLRPLNLSAKQLSEASGIVLSVKGKDPSELAREIRALLTSEQLPAFEKITESGGLSKSLPADAERSSPKPAAVPMKGAHVDSKQVAIQVCNDRGKKDTRYALPVGASAEVYGPWKSTWSFGWNNDGFNKIGDRLWQVVYTKQQTHEWKTMIWINAENGNLRIMRPEYSDGGLVIRNQKEAQKDAAPNP